MPTTRRENLPDGFPGGGRGDAVGVPERPHPVICQRDQHGDQQSREDHRHQLHQQEHGGNLPRMSRSARQTQVRAFKVRLSWVHTIAYPQGTTDQVQVASLNIKIIHHPPTVRLGALRPESDYVLVFKSPPIGSAGLWPKIILCGQAGAAVEKGRKTSVPQGEFVEGFWPPPHRAQTPFRAGLYARRSRHLELESAWRQATQAWRGRIVIDLSG